MKRFLAVIVWSFLFISSPFVANAATVDWKGQTWTLGDKSTGTVTDDDSLKLAYDGFFGQLDFSTSLAGQNGVLWSFKRGSTDSSPVIFRLNDSGSDGFVEIGITKEYNYTTRVYDCTPYLRYSADGSATYAVNETGSPIAESLDTTWTVRLAVNGDSLEYDFHDISGTYDLGGKSFTIGDFKYGSGGSVLNKIELTKLTLNPAALVKHAVTISTGDNGSASPTGEKQVIAGNDLPVTLTPASGYLLDKVTLDGNAVAADEITVVEDFTKKYVLKNVTGAHAIHATFKEHPPLIIDASVVGSGIIEPSGEVSVPYKGSQQFVLTPAEGYEIENLYVNGDRVWSPNSPHTISNVTKHGDIEVHYTKKKYRISMQSYGGSIKPSDFYGYDLEYGATQTFRFFPDSSKAIKDVVIDNKSQGAISSYTFTNVQETHSIEMVYENADYTITPQSPSNGSISPYRNTGVLNGGNFTFTFTPNKGYEVKQVLVDGVKVAGKVDSYTVTNVTADKTIAVEFAEISGTPTHTVTASSGAGGSISPTGAVSVDQGADKVFTITPDDGYVIKDVLVDGSSVGKKSSHTFTNVQGAHTIAASFQLAPKPTFTVTASSGSGGSISPSGAVSVTQGEDKAFTITPDAGYNIKDVLVDGSSVGKVTSHTISNVQKPYTIAASFEPIQYTVTVQNSDNGSVTASAAKVNHGQSVTFTVTPASGYKVASFVVNGEAVAVSGTSATVANVTKNLTAQATFIAVSNDTDGDGLNDAWEREHFGDLSKDGSEDSDGDGLTDKEEYRLGADPKDSDSDDDGMPDGWESENGLNLNVDDANADSDGDGISNLEEFKAKTDPQDASSKPGAAKAGLPVPVMKMIME